MQFLARYWHGTEARVVLLETPMRKEPTGKRGVDDPDIARWEVSEDGVNWRPYDPRRDTNPLLHKRIEFAAPAEERCGAAQAGRVS